MCLDSLWYGHDNWVGLLLNYHNTDADNAGVFFQELQMSLFGLIILFLALALLVVV